MKVAGNTREILWAKFAGFRHAARSRFYLGATRAVKTAVRFTRVQRSVPAAFGDAMGTAGCKFDVGWRRMDPTCAAVVWCRERVSAWVVPLDVGSSAYGVELRVGRIPKRHAGLDAGYGQGGARAAAVVIASDDVPAQTAIVDLREVHRGAVRSGVLASAAAPCASAVTCAFGARADAPQASGRPDRPWWWSASKRLAASPAVAACCAPRMCRLRAWQDAAGGGTGGAALRARRSGEGHGRRTPGGGSRAARADRCNTWWSFGAGPQRGWKSASDCPRWKCAQLIASVDSFHPNMTRWRFPWVLKLATGGRGIWVVRIVTSSITLMPERCGGVHG